MSAKPLVQALFLMLVVGAVGCQTDTSKPATEGDPDGGDSDGNLVCNQPVACADQAILQLGLKTTVATGEITNTADSTNWVSVVDATAGGMSPTMSYVYATFADTGLTKVALDDESALDSADWDIAFRRFVIRLNGGDSGAGCTQAVNMPAGTAYADVATVPADPPYLVDDYFTDTCDFIGDSYGMGSPSTYMSDFWTYPQSCVAMSGAVYVLQLRSGRHVKLTVEAYYWPTIQDQCQTDGSVPMDGSAGSAHIQARWAFLD